MTAIPLMKNFLEKAACDEQPERREGTEEGR